MSIEQIVIGVKSIQVEDIEQIIPVQQCGSLLI